MTSFAVAGVGARGRSSGWRIKAGSDELMKTRE